MLYGIYVLNPFYTDWLITGGDLTQHYLGWEFFRRSEWLFPIRLINLVGYLAETSVIYTDSIPLFAVIGALQLTKRVGKNRIITYALLSISFVIQIYDISGKLLEKHDSYAYAVEKGITLESNFWDKTDTTGYEHVAWISHNIDRRKILFVADWR